MKYLYGDLTEFPVGENLLASLEKMLVMSVELLLLEAAAGEVLAKMESRRGWLAEFLQKLKVIRKDLDSLFRQRIDAEGEWGKHFERLAVQLSEAVSSCCTSARNKTVSSVEDEIRQIEHRLEEIRAKALEACRKFFTPSSLPIRSSMLTCKLEQGTYAAALSVTDIAGITCVYDSPTPGGDIFTEPRKLSELVPGRCELAVGLKKSWLKKEPVAETIKAGEFVLSAIVDSDDSASMRLEKRPGAESESIEAVIDKASSKLMSMQRTASGSCRAVDEQLLAENQYLFEQLWQVLSPAIVEMYKAPANLVSVSIDGRDIMDGQSATELVRRLVEFYAPTVREIDARSPSPHELCLKLERNNGRREEFYLPKARLAELLARLPAWKRALFTPFGIDPALVEKTEEETFDDGPTVPDKA